MVWLSSNAVQAATARETQRVGPRRAHDERLSAEAGAGLAGLRERVGTLLDRELQPAPGMLFNSLQFAAFFAVVYSLYRVLPFRWQNRMLFVAGYVFYGAWDVRFLFLIAFSTAVDYVIGVVMGTGRIEKSQRWTATSFLVGAAALFLCPDWHGLMNTGTLGMRMEGVQILAGTIVFAVIANLLLDRAIRLDEMRRRKVFVAASVVVNLTFLGFFKYFNFFVDSAGALLHGMGFDPAGLRLHIVLPVGISFYTFQSLSYTIDVYRGRVRPTHNFWDFALFVSYFPPMVAGPIERARHLLPQLTSPRRITAWQSANGMLLILLGLFKKVAIADGIAPSVDAVFNSTGPVSQMDVALAVVLFAIQILCDFSGYSDIARGVSKLLGIELMVNFNLPYFAQNPSDFWRRWHISLSTWLRDYLYISLGGNRNGALKTYRNLLLTMLLGGLWHGAAWNYVLWGAYQGLLLCGHRMLLAARETIAAPAHHSVGAAAVPTQSRIPFANLETVLVPLRIASFFLLVCYGWLLFRATSLEQCRTFTLTLFGFAPNVPSVLAKPATAAFAGMALLAVMQVADYRAGCLESFRRWPIPAQGALYASLIFVLIMGLSNAPVQFIYFQF
jgi:D-alanyl-lipoteichoic acid acyltransferase DltB (MBOAT superfamily)